MVENHCPVLLELNPAFPCTKWGNPVSIPYTKIQNIITIYTKILLCI